MSISELIKEHGEGVKLTSLKFSPKAWCKVINMYKDRYWMENHRGDMFTVGPEDAKAGWAKYIENTKVKMCGWYFYGSTDEKSFYVEYVPSGINPWEKAAADGKRAELAAWHRIEQFDFDIETLQ